MLPLGESPGVAWSNLATRERTRAARAGLAARRIRVLERGSAMTVVR